MMSAIKRHIIVTIKQRVPIMMENFLAIVTLDIMGTVQTANVSNIYQCNMRIFLLFIFHYKIDIIKSTTKSF